MKFLLLGLPRATIAASKEMPEGTPGRPTRKSVSFFLKIILKLDFFFNDRILLF